MNLDHMSERSLYFCTLKKGWYNGNGNPYSRQEVAWFLNGVERQWLSASLPTPYLYPMPGGGIQLEWEFKRPDGKTFCLSLELNLDARTGDLHCDEVRIDSEGLRFDIVYGWSKVADALRYIKRTGCASREPGHLEKAARGQRR